MNTIQVLVRRDHLATARLRQVAEFDLAAGQVQVRVDAFALTSNNITYAAFGEIPIRFTGNQHRWQLQLVQKLADARHIVCLAPVCSGAWAVFMLLPGSLTQQISGIRQGASQFQWRCA